MWIHLQCVPIILLSLSVVVVGYSSEKNNAISPPQPPEFQLSSRKYFTLDIEKEYIKNEEIRIHDSRIEKRSKTMGQIIQNKIYYYTIQFGLGTPPQRFKLQIDTGSSDIWVTSLSNPFCLEAVPFNASIDPKAKFSCLEQGLFNDELSSTYQNKGDTLVLRYADGSYAVGNFGADVLRLDNGLTVNNMDFIRAHEATTFGVFGIGLSGLEVAAHRIYSPYEYKNLPVRLREGGIIDSLAYSLWLNTVDSDAGKIIFGGVDPSRYTGPLVMINLVPSIKNRTIEFTVPASTITFHEELCAKSQVLSTEEIVVLADVGSTASYLPPPVSAYLIDRFDLTQDEDGLYITTCSNTWFNNKFLTIDISGFVLKVPIKDLFVPKTDTHGNPFLFPDGEHICFLGVFPLDDPKFCSLGDNILRSAYMVFDLENRRLGIAQSYLNNPNMSTFNAKGQSKGVETIGPELYGVPNSVDSRAIPVGLDWCQFSGFNEKAINGRPFDFPFLTINSTYANDTARKNSFLPSSYYEDVRSPGYGPSTPFFEEDSKMPGAHSVFFDPSTDNWYKTMPTPAPAPSTISTQNNFTLLSEIKTTNNDSISTMIETELIEEYLTGLTTVVRTIATVRTVTRSKSSTPTPVFSSNSTGTETNYITETDGTVYLVHEYETTEYGVHQYPLTDVSGYATAMTATTTSRVFTTTVSQPYTVLSSVLRTSAFTTPTPTPVEIIASATTIQSIITPTSILSFDENENDIVDVVTDISYITQTLYAADSENIYTTIVKTMYSLRTVRKSDSMLTLPLSQTFDSPEAELSNISTNAIVTETAQDYYYEYSYDYSTIVVAPTGTETEYLTIFETFSIVRTIWRAKPTASSNVVTTIDPEATTILDTLVSASSSPIALVTPTSEVPASITLMPTEDDDNESVSVSAFFSDKVSSSTEAEYIIDSSSLPYTAEFESASNTKLPLVIPTTESDSSIDLISSEDSQEYEFTILPELPTITTETTMSLDVSETIIAEPTIISNTVSKIHEPSKSSPTTPTDTLTSYKSSASSVKTSTAPEFKSSLTVTELFIISVSSVPDPFTVYPSSASTLSTSPKTGLTSIPSTVSIPFVDNLVSDNQSKSKPNIKPIPTVISTKVSDSRASSKSVSDISYKSATYSGTKTKDLVGTIDYSTEIKTMDLVTSKTYSFAPDTSAAMESKSTFEYASKPAKSKSHYIDPDVENSSTGKSGLFIPTTISGTSTLLSVPYPYISGKPVVIPTEIKGVYTTIVVSCPLVTDDPCVVGSHTVIVDTKSYSPKPSKDDIPTSNPTSEKAFVSNSIISSVYFCSKTEICTTYVTIPCEPTIVSTEPQIPVKPSLPSSIPVIQPSLKLQSSTEQSLPNFTHISQPLIETKSHLPVHTPGIQPPVVSSHETIHTPKQTYPLPKNETSTTTILYNLAPTSDGPKTDLPFQTPGSADFPKANDQKPVTSTVTKSYTGGGQQDKTGSGFASINTQPVAPYPEALVPPVAQVNFAVGSYRLPKRCLIGLILYWVYIAI